MAMKLICLVFLLLVGLAQVVAQTADHGRPAFAVASVKLSNSLGRPEVGNFNGRGGQCPQLPHNGDNRQRLHGRTEGTSVPSLIIGDDRHKRKILPNGGFQIGHIEREGAIAL
jgi:hypothetical protein